LCQDFFNLQQPSALHLRLAASTPPLDHFYTSTFTPALEPFGCNQWPIFNRALIDNLQTANGTSMAKCVHNFDGHNWPGNCILKVENLLFRDVMIVLNEENTFKWQSGQSQTPYFRPNQVTEPHQLILCLSDMPYQT
jgi:hypothetical protein